MNSPALLNTTRFQLLDFQIGKTRVGLSCSLTSCCRDARKDSLHSSNGGLTVDEDRQNSWSDLGGLDDDGESWDWIRVSADSAGEARQSAGSSAVWGGARVEWRGSAREDSKDEEGWVIDTWANWVAWELFARWRSTDGRWWG